MMPQRPLAKIITAAAFAAAVSLICDKVSAQETLSLEQMRNLAVVSLDRGNVDLAKTVAETLIRSNPADPAGLGVLSFIALSERDYTSSRDYAALLWANSDDPEKRYQAARIAAFSWTEMGVPLLGEFWLRRALTVAQDEEQVSETNRDLRVVRDRNPLRINISFSASPSSNVTQGAEDKTITINGDTLGLFFGGSFLPLSPSAIDRAYGGVSYRSSVGLSYRLYETQDSLTYLRVNGAYRGVFLDEKSRDDLAGEKYNGEQIENRHFSMGQASIGVEHLISAFNGQISLSGTLGRSWSRADLSEDFVTVSSGYTLFWNQRMATGFNLSRRWGRDAISSSDRPPVIENELSFSHIQGFSDGSRLSAGVSVAESFSSFDRNDHNQYSLNMSWRPNDPWESITVDYNFSVTKTHYQNFSYISKVDGGRTDYSYRVGSSISLDGVSYMGFSPVLSIDASMTDSNISQFASDGVSVGFGVRSSF